ncbi:hypothetical protein [Leifsonia aquatica]|uniref:hypothetical protein n=1 Tax=Leifsonia aquatica TaxID=144185 RepID=UPI00382C5ABA
MAAEYERSFRLSVDIPNRTVRFETRTGGISVTHETDDLSVTLDELFEEADRRSSEAFNDPDHWTRDGEYRPFRIDLT